MVLTKYTKRKIILRECMGRLKEKAKASEYGTQLMEKQKAKYTYGILSGSSRIFF